MRARKNQPERGAAARDILDENLGVVCIGHLLDDG